MVKDHFIHHCDICDFCRSARAQLSMPQNFQVSITQNSTFSTIVYHNSKLFDTRTSKADLITSEVLSVKLHGEEKEVKKGFSIDLTIKVLLDSTAECRWYDTGNLWSYNS